MSPIGTSQELLDIIRARSLTSVFQPVVDLQTPNLFGYEALTRGPADSALHSPMALFDTAGRYGLMGALEFACREVACSRFTQLGGTGKLFLNVSPMSLIEPGYQQGMTTRILTELGLPAERLVIELSEQYPLEDYHLMRNATEHFRRMGFEIAIDDLGAGYAGLRAWSELRPDYVKVDRHFIEQIDTDPVKREFLRSILDIANELGCRVVAEGIETLEQLETVRAMGVHYGQGYFLGRPETVPAAPAIVCARLGAAPQRTPRSLRRSQQVGDIALSAPAIDEETPLNAVVDLFHVHRNLSSLPVLRDKIPIGLVRRDTILELFAARYSRELYGRRPARLFLDRDTLIMPAASTLEEVSQRLTAGGDQPLAQDFIISRDGEFFGIGKPSALLRKITEQQIRSARYANPLTQLPGNVPIHELLEELLEQREPFRVAYFDLDHFKPFNDRYGYTRGDEVILLLAQLLVTHLDVGSNFVGHVGGDDFVVVLREPDWEEGCRTVLQQFGHEIGQYYDREALTAGGIQALNRVGESQFFPLLSLSVGVVRPDPASCHSYHAVAALAMDAKQAAKRIPGSALFISRRRRSAQRESIGQRRHLLTSCV